MEDYRWRRNYRNLLHIIFWPALLAMMLPLMTLTTGWLLFALGVLVVLGATIYALGRLERVSF